MGDIEGKRNGSGIGRRGGEEWRIKKGQLWRGGGMESRRTGRANNGERRTRSEKEQ